MSSAIERYKYGLAKQMPADCTSITIDSYYGALVIDDTELARAITKNTRRLIEAHVAQMEAERAHADAEAEDNAWPAGEHIHWYCPQCDEEYSLPEETCTCPICQSKEIEEI